MRSHPLSRRLWTDWKRLARRSRESVFQSLPKMASRVDFTFDYAAKLKPLADRVPDPPTRHQSCTRNQNQHRGCPGDEYEDREFEAIAEHATKRTWSWRASNPCAGSAENVSAAGLFGDLGHNRTLAYSIHQQRSSEVHGCARHSPSDQLRRLRAGCGAEKEADRSARVL